MPTIQYNKGGGKIIYDVKDWFAGYDKIQNTLTTRSNIGDGFARVQNINPYRKLGYLTVSQESVAVTDVASVTGIIKNAVVKEDSAFLIASDKVHRLDTLLSGTINTTAPFPHTIDHAHVGETGSDCVNYYVGDTLKMFYSFYDNTDWDVGVYDYAADTFDDNFMSTIPASPLAGTDLTDGKVLPHPMIVGDDDILYMGSGRDVHAFDGQTGANGTFSSKVLTLPKGWTITCFEKRPNNKLAIGAYYNPPGGSSTFNRGEAKVWIWGYLELDIDISYIVEDNYISELFNWNGTMACFTSGKRSAGVSDMYKLHVFDGEKFVTVVQYKDGGLPIRGGVDVVGSDVYWNAGGLIYSYVKNPATGKYAFNKLYGSGTGSSGMLKFFSNSFKIHYSFGATAVTALNYFGNGNYASTGFIYGKTATPYFPVSKKGRLKSVTIVYKNVLTTGGREFDLNTDLDEVGSVTTPKISAVTDTQVIYYKRNDGADLGDFNSLMPALEWYTGDGNSKAPIIERIEYDYELINI